MPTALDNDHLYNFTLLAPASVGDLNADAATARGGRLGSMFFANDAFGLRLYMLVQNRHTAAVVKGALMSAVGDTNGMTQITTSGGAAANTKVKATTTGLTANVHQGGGIYIQNCTTSAGAAPEGEDSVVASNSATEVFVDPRNAFSAVIASGDTVNLHGIANGELAAAGDLAYAVLGVVVGKDGISAGNFGFVSRMGYTPNTLVKAATGLTQNQAVIADAGRVAPASASATNLLLGTAPNVVVSDIVSDKTTIVLALGLGFSPGTAAGTA